MMAHSDDRVLVIEQFLSTHRRIREVEREALTKLGAKVPSGNQCSFCGRTKEEVCFLIQGIGDARICERCVAKVHNMLNDTSGEQDAL
jgi:hypothetical protein